MAPTKIREERRGLSRKGASARVTGPLPGAESWALTQNPYQDQGTSGRRTFVSKEDSAALPQANEVLGYEL